MTDGTKNTTIHQANTGFPDYLDFDKLRKEGIEYLGKLTGKIWTDYNVHDPGITILETLCYALLDLGYRTNLPAIDIFTADPNSNSEPNNFFTPAQILTCNPLTITDYRKMLIDIEGVKNAWLTIEDNSYNGLYHVYLDLENGLHAEEEDEVVIKVKKTLMTHRNLCEDFLDIVILCKIELGVCADLELEDNAAEEQVYINVVEKLVAFFSPSLHFYTLQQLLDKGKSIDEIFVGRPFNITESHGFIDTEELKEIPLRKEIHLSDVYHAIFDVEGIRGISNLQLRSKENSDIIPIKGWRYHLPKNHVPYFSLDCSGFQFHRKGRPVFIDFSRFESLFTISLAQAAKTQYKTPSPYLDVQIPVGVYHKDLANYYSIQNELPRVYGIAKGGLPDNASAQRIAQALQLKAWLLFFDQLLANYASQLKNIPSLFATSTSDAKDNHTYFINQLKTVPDHQKLVRFHLDTNDTNTLGNEGSVLVMPVKKKQLIALAAQADLKSLSVDALEPYTFGTIAEKDIAICQLKNDLFFKQYHCEYVIKNDECVYYYILTTSDEIALICKRYFKDIAQANVHATSVHYIGTFDENYRSFITADKTFSFNIELNLQSFSKYLQLIVEDKNLFYKRRKFFLNHLLARFAEQFTDYAMLTFGFQDDDQLQKSEINYKEEYLTNYPELSSNRGQAYNYLMNTTAEKNISGFEKKIIALSGMGYQAQSSLCNFVVAKYEEQFDVTLKIGTTTFFSTQDKFDSKIEAQKAAQWVFEAMQQRGNYEIVPIHHDATFKVALKYANERSALLPQSFNTEKDALDAADLLSGLFEKQSPEASVFASSYTYTPLLKDASGRTIRRSVAFYNTEREAKSAALKIIKKIDDSAIWQVVTSGSSLGSLYPAPITEEDLTLINISAFKVDIDNSVIDKPEIFTYEVLDKENTFKFRSTTEYASAYKAKKSAWTLLASLTDPSNYEIIQTPNLKFKIRIRNIDTILADTSFESDSKEEILNMQNRILQIVRSHLYTFEIDKEADRWKFNYQVGYQMNNLHQFESIKSYKKESEAVDAAKQFFDAAATLQVKKTKNDLTLIPKNIKTNPSAVKWTGRPDMKSHADIEATFKELVFAHQRIATLSKQSHPVDFQSSVMVNQASAQGQYVYRLVHKDYIPAFYSRTFSDEESAKEELKTVVKAFSQADGYLRICMGGSNVTHKIKDENTKKIWYHYQITSLNPVIDENGAIPKSQILFESVKGYESEKEAEQAFSENYLHIIHLGSDISNYGKEISLTETFIHHQNFERENEYLVFVPRITQDSLEITSEQAIHHLANLCKSYPIRKVTFESPGFYQLFPCEKQNAVDETLCKKAKNKLVYYYVLYEGGADHWQSSKYYSTPEEARKAFDFLRILLYYPGNYFVDCDTCSQVEGENFKIYIREVLAESTDRFTTEEMAWGHEGIQKFICLAQSEDPFHPYLRQNDCCYSFYVSCKNSLIYHPCKYDTAQRRDKALLDLYQSLKEWVRQRSWQIITKEQNLELTDASGLSFATITLRKDNYCNSDLIYDLSEISSIVDNFKETEEKYLLVDKNNNTIAFSNRTNLTFLEWKEMLRTFLCLYPIVKYKNEAKDTHRYCIEIKLPGFNSCKEDITEYTPCGCGKEAKKPDYKCYIAWKSSVCYDQCTEADKALQIFIRLLQHYEFYQPVFDCTCGSYGVALQFETNQYPIHEKETSANTKEDIRSRYSNEIVAINPQCYPSMEEACQATLRATNLINAEGLHLVEHLLLRPQASQNEDCMRNKTQFANATNCEFVWSKVAGDPCETEKEVHFIPGADPYSFIATVALPAWPTRFRKTENREMLENIIYSETPAHILLRILWMTPHDFCCFETKFNKWQRWVAMKNNCYGNFSVCDFVEFLLRRNYEYLEDCSICTIDYDAPRSTLPCTNEMKDVTNKNEYLNQINDLFGWEQQNKDQYQYLECENARQYNLNENKENSEYSSLQPTKKTQHAEFKAINSKRKSQVINARLGRYKTSVETALEKYKDNPVYAKMLSFMEDPLPDYKRLLGVATEIMHNKKFKTGNNTILPLALKQHLMENHISYWLDRHFLNKKNKNELRRISVLLKKLEKAKINTKKIYQYWDLDEIKEYEPTINQEEIAKLFKLDA